MTARLVDDVMVYRSIVCDASLQCEFTVFTSLVLASQRSRGGMQVCTLFHNLSEDEKGLYEVRFW